MRRRIQADVQRDATDRVDLGLRHVELARGRRPETRAQRTAERQPVRHLVARRRLPPRLSTERLVILEPGGKIDEPGVGDVGGQIGRASCRERVCQYVSISVVAVSLKKKIKHNKLQTK